MEKTIADILKLSAENAVGITSSSPYTGSPTFDTIPFLVKPECRPLLGAFAAVPSHDGVCVHYGYIVEGREENLRADPNRLQQNISYGMQVKPAREGDLSPHVVRVMAIQVLGELRLVDGRLQIQEPLNLPATGQTVHILDSSVFISLLCGEREGIDGLEIGELTSGDTRVSVFLPVEALARQITIVGKSGSGKSYAVMVMVEELVRLGIPVISFDLLGDLIEATKELGGRNLNAGADLKVHFALLGWSEFESFINFTKDQREIVAVVYDLVHGRALEQIDENGRVDITLQDFLNQVEMFGRDSGQEVAARNAKRRIDAAFRRSSILTDDFPKWLDELGDAPILNVYVGHLPQRSRSLVVASAARILQVRRRREQIPPFVMILDEAHMFLPAGADSPSTTVIRELVRTARHDAVGVILVSQSPASMDRQAFLLCNTRLVFALDPEDLRLVSGYLGELSQTVIDRIPRMRRGTAILSSSMDLLRHPLRIDIREKHLISQGAPTPNLARETAKWRENNR